MSSTAGGRVGNYRRVWRREVKTMNTSCLVDDAPTAADLRRPSAYGLQPAARGGVLSCKRSILVTKMSVPRSSSAHCEDAPGQTRRGQLERASSAGILRDLWLSTRPGKRNVACLAGHLPGRELKRLTKLEQLPSLCRSSSPTAAVTKNFLGHALGLVQYPRPRFGHTKPNLACSKDVVSPIAIGCLLQQGSYTRG